MVAWRGVARLGWLGWLGWHRDGNSVEVEADELRSGLPLHISCSDKFGFDGDAALLRLCSRFACVGGLSHLFSLSPARACAQPLHTGDGPVGFSGIDGSAPVQVSLRSSSCMLTPFLHLHLSLGRRTSTSP